MTVAEFWEHYCADTGQRYDETTFSGELCFEHGGIVGRAQLALVLAGRKTALFTPFDAYAINREPLPMVGEMYVVEDSDGEPRCIIEVTAVQVLPFDDVSWERARLEGEDESLSDWRDRQREYMQEEADLCGFRFDDRSCVVFETFTVIYR